MFTAENTTTIHRPITAVFEYVVEPTNIPVWRPNTIEVRNVERPLRTGSTYSILENQMGKHEFGQRVTAFEPNRLIVIETTSGNIRPVQHFTFESNASGGTTYHARLEVRTTGFMRLFEPLMKGMVRKTMVTYGENLKRALEASAGS